MSMITGKVRILYPQLNEPKSFKDSGEPRYSATLLIDKDDDDTIQAIRQEMKDAFDYAKSHGKLPKNCTWENITKFVHDGDEEKPDSEAHENMFYLNAKNKRQPGCYGPDAEKIAPTEFYGGCYVKADISFWAYEFGGNTGISCSLWGVQFVDDGEPIGFGGESHFDPLDEDDMPKRRSGFKNVDEDGVIHDDDEDDADSEKPDDGKKKKDADGNVDYSRWSKKKLKAELDEREIDYDDDDDKEDLISYLEEDDDTPFDEDDEPEPEPEKKKKQSGKKKSHGSDMFV